MVGSPDYHTDCPNGTWRHDSVLGSPDRMVSEDVLGSPDYPRARYRPPREKVECGSPASLNLGGEQSPGAQLESLKLLCPVAPIAKVMLD